MERQDNNPRCDTSERVSTRTRAVPTRALAADSCHGGDRPRRQCASWQRRRPRCWWLPHACGHPHRPARDDRKGRGPVVRPHCSLSTKQKTGPKARPRSSFRRLQPRDCFRPAAAASGAIASATPRSCPTAGAGASGLSRKRSPGLTTPDDCHRVDPCASAPRNTASSPRLLQGGSNAYGSLSTSLRGVHTGGSSSWASRRSRSRLMIASTPFPRARATKRCSGLELYRDPRRPRVECGSPLTTGFKHASAGAYRLPSSTGSSWRCARIAGIAASAKLNKR